MSGDVYGFLAFQWFVSVILATAMGGDRGRWAEGFMCGLLLGPVGVVAAGLLTPSAKRLIKREEDLEWERHKRADKIAKARAHEMERTARRVAKDSARALNRGVERSQAKR